MTVNRAPIFAAVNIFYDRGTYLRAAMNNRGPCYRSAGQLPSNSIFMDERRVPNPTFSRNLRAPFVFFFFSFLISSTPFALFHRPSLSLFYLHLYNTSLFLSLSKYILSNFVFVIYIFFCFLFHLFVCSAFLCGFLFLHLDMFLCFFIYLSIYRSFFFYIYVYFTCVFLRDLNISAVFWRCERTLLKRI